MMRGRAVRRFAAACAVAVALASCSHSARHATPSGPVTTAARPDVFVAMGSNATLGDGLEQPLTQGWPQLVFHDAFPISAVFVNAGDLQESAHGVLIRAVPLALEVHATAVAIWIGGSGGDASVQDLNDFATNLDLAVRKLRASGARVVIGNLPGGVHGASALNAAIARIARTRGATVVDLASALSTTSKVGPGSKLTLSTSRAIAAAFTAALSSS